MDSNHKAIVMAARTEVQRMRAAVEGVQDGAQVTMATDQFASLADLMEKLADVVAFWPEDMLDDPRYWVPLGHFQRIKAQADHWRSEAGRLIDATSFEDVLRF